jgi:O-antigen ligase
MSAPPRTIRNGHEDHWWLGYLIVLVAGLAVAFIARRQVTQPWVGLSLILMLLMLLGWLIHPRLTLTVVLFLAAVSDLVTVSWFPFLKNLSSRESISYVADALTVSPVDIVLATGALIVASRGFAENRRFLPSHPLRWPLVVFASFVCFGYVRGIVMRNGNLRIAVFEGRALFYILLVFVIAVHVYTESRHYRLGLFAILAGVFVQSLLSIEYVGRLEPAQRDALESLTEHGSTLGQNLLLVALLAVIVFSPKSPFVKAALLIAAVPTTYVFLIGQRRAGMATFMVAGVLLAVTLFWRRRRLFWITVPAAAAATTGYVAAFWNSSSPSALPARAVKSIISPESASARDQSSDLYRIVENYNLVFTIRAEPYLGIGFGRPFYRPVALADISWFEFHAYIPHNSILWIWVKLGFAGFVVLFYLVAKSILLGAERVRREVDQRDLVVQLCVTSFIVMFAAYAYVDIAWEARNAIILGFALACVGAPLHRPTDDRPDAAMTPGGQPLEARSDVSHPSASNA